MNPKERDELLDALLDGQISEADLLRIEAELSVDPAVRTQYYRKLQLDLLLQREAAPPKTEEKDSGQVSLGSHQDTARKIGKSTRTISFSLLAMAAIVLLAFFFSRFPSGQDPRLIDNVVSQISERSASGFGVLSGQSEAVWGSASMKNGELLREGDMHLKSGLVHLELFSGVQIVLQGESRFSIDSPMQVTLKSGRARARVPQPAQGFRIKTVSGEIVDLGTEFAVRSFDRSVTTTAPSLANE